MKEYKKCCFTGYRPSKLPFNVYIRDKAYNDFENLVTEGILKLYNEDCRVFYTGMAMGFDIICAETVLLLKRLYNCEIKLICAIPFKEQPEKYDEHWRKRYFDILAQCDEKVILSDSYNKGCYQKRNEYMVDNSDYVMTWFDGKQGGTKNTVNYAIKQNKFVLNLNKNSTENYSYQTTFEIF
ncbi:MAG: DUF1273 family protein [Clostridia bacterium]|nr:DUF1273 family protein [Clostridia bacterium]